MKDIVAGISKQLLKLDQDESIAEITCGIGEGSTSFQRCLTGSFMAFNQCAI